MEKIEISKKIELLLEKLPYTSFIKKRLEKVLLKYEYCRINKLHQYPYDVKELNVQEFNRHFVGFMDGDGILRSGKRIGHKKGLFRFAPNLGIDLIKYDLNYLELIKKMLVLPDKNIYIIQRIKYHYTFQAKKN